METVINQAMRLIAEFFDVDWCSVGLFDAGRTRLTRKFEYPRAGTRSVPEFLLKEQSPWYLGHMLQGGTAVINRLEDLPPEAEKERRLCLNQGIKSVLSVPLISGGIPIGTFALVSVRSERSWLGEIIGRLRLLGEIIANFLELNRSRIELKERLLEILELKKIVDMENISLRKEVDKLSGGSEVLGQSSPIKHVLAQVEQVAGTDSTVLLQGETGTGKELLARLIHRISRRDGKPMVTVNCVSLPPSLIEGELFGRERGAYTGALTRMVGRIEIADGSTLFLDEISEFPLELQGKLLRVLEEGTFERLGSTKTIRVNIRIVAATNRDLEEAVKQGRFRSDLYYRLNVFPIYVPPLRERREDIPLLVWSFVEEFQKRMGKRIDSIPENDIENLKAYDWPGNIRELRNIIERAIITCNSRVLSIATPWAPAARMPAKNDLSEIERSHILSVLEKTNWRLMGKNGAAEILGLKRTTLHSKMKKLGITRHTH